ncbi:MAG: YbjQ family protein [Desulfurococcales archaeon]|nr:YbjQ family protein [Desulfurococcales archaeon]
MSQDVIVVTTDEVPGYRVVKVLGLVSGSAARARHIGKDIMAALRNIAGGEVKEYTELMAESRNLALKRMVEKARELGANAVIGVRMATSMIAQGVAEIVYYGTAVIIEPKEA